MIRMILRYLANNEQLVQRLAESYPMRRAAQLLVSDFYKGRTIAQEQKLGDMTPERFKRMMDAFKANMKQEIEAAKQNLKKRK
ncbi:protein NCBP2AS2 homolog [Aedes albopictus]|uniref:Uncharacterized protein n=1 Tax=Aedes albopictus TaxID=7160 RepID=A0ABM1ZUY5_AEDAL